MEIPKEGQNICLFVNKLQRAPRLKEFDIPQRLSGCVPCHSLPILHTWNQDTSTELRINKVQSKFLKLQPMHFKICKALDNLLAYPHPLPTHTHTTNIGFSKQCSIKDRL